jgi:hypothetical protein
MPESNSKPRIFTIARLFFLLVVIPLLLISSLIAFSIFKFGGISKSDAATSLDQKSKNEILTRAIDLSQNIAGFLNERQKDILITTIFPANAETYSSFLNAKTQELWVKKDGVIMKEALPLYVEMSLTDKSGQEIIKIKNGKIASANELVNISSPVNTTYKSEDYFTKAKGLNKGEVYFSPVTGWYINKAEFDSGKRFEGLIRMATPVFDKQGFTGVLTLALDVRHLAKFTDNIVPTESTYVIKADANTGNYAYLVDNRGFVIAHPNDYFIAGLYKDGTSVPQINSSNYQEMKKKGEEVINFKDLGGIEPMLPEIEKEAETGKSGIKTYTFDGHTKVVAYAPVPFYSKEFPKPAGFGWVGMGVDVDKFHEQALLSQKKIEKEGQRWLTTIILILFIAMAILFAIAAILSRGINRSIESEVPEGSVSPGEYDKD